MPDPGFPVFDADNHLYESPEMLTEYLPEEYARDIQFVQVRGRARRSPRPVPTSTSTVAPTPKE